VAVRCSKAQLSLESASPRMACPHVSCRVERSERSKTSCESSATLGDGQAPKGCRISLVRPRGIDEDKTPGISAFKLGMGGHLYELVASTGDVSHGVCGPA